MRGPRVSRSAPDHGDGDGDDDNSPESPDPESVVTPSLLMDAYTHAGTLTDF